MKYTIHTLVFSVAMAACVGLTSAGHAATAAGTAETAITQVGMLAQAAGISPEEMKQRLIDLGVPMQTAADSILALLKWDAKKHAEVVAAAIQG